MGLRFIHLLMLATKLPIVLALTRDLWGYLDGGSRTRGNGGLEAVWECSMRYVLVSRTGIVGGTSERIQPRF